MNTQLKLLLEEMIKNKVPAEVNGIETKVALREVKPEFYAYDKYTEKDIKIIICPRYIKPELVKHLLSVLNSHLKIWNRNYQPKN